ncbi:transketolase family protein [Kosmotoga pacifica]|uniref:Transketolase n=1 Tax=Kosmotoga pacifica TaxID=1330330 RepID=A0A0G2ZF29_9BACT|nr:transketolase family protein [Kosmotoga pacifica]AKI97423.1 transketolase [Kosmotoga pacifica]
MIKLVKERKPDPVMMRDVYIDQLIELAKEDPNIIVLDADLMHSNATYRFMEKYPDRAFNVGVQEANMMGIAAGLSATGKIPFTHTFACFSTRRALDQVYISIAYNRLNVKMIATDPGITAAYNGGTHMPLEDVGFMRGIPTVTIIEPVDTVMMKGLLKDITYTYGPIYVRVSRKSTTRIFEEGSRFEIGKGLTLRDGKDVTIVATGIMVAEALDAADLLEREGISARVVNIFTIKPLDRELIEKCAAETGAIVTAENHNIYNGLGSAVAEVIAETHPVPMERVGVKDLFGEVGSVDYLKKRFNMTAQDIADSVKRVLSRK